MDGTIFSSEYKTIFHVAPSHMHWRLDVHTITLVAQLVQFRSFVGLAALHASVTEVVHPVNSMLKAGN